MSSRTRTASTITPAVLYHDAPAAIDWLCRAFDLEKRLVVPDGNGGIAHATLSFGNGMIMLSSAETNGFPNLIKAPRQVGGIGTHEIIVYVAEVDAHHARATASGAEIVMPLEDKPYGGRGYSARDPEGHVWHFSSYDPWADEAVSGAQP